MASVEDFLRKNPALGISARRGLTLKVTVRFLSAERVEFAYQGARYSISGTDVLDIVDDAGLHVNVEGVGKPVFLTLDRDALLARQVDLPAATLIYQSPPSFGSVMPLQNPTHTIGTTLIHSYTTSGAGHYIDDDAWDQNADDSD